MRPKDFIEFSAAQDDLRMVMDELSRIGRFTLHSRNGI
jgi:hypothetical protein